MPKAGKKRVQGPEIADKYSLFAAVKDEDVIDEIRKLDVMRMTPMDALATLDRIQKKLENRWQAD